MKGFIGIMMTARGCGHCAQSRGNGIMGSGPHFMKPSVVDEFLSISDDIMFMNIHFQSMGGKVSQIIEMSKFSKKGTQIIQEFWAVDEGNTVKFNIITTDTETKKFNQQTISPVIDNSGKNLIWENFVKQKISPKLENYTYYYPCFVIANTKDWIRSIETGAELTMLTNAGKTKEEEGRIFLDRDGKTFNERMVDPKKLFADVSSNSVKIEPHIRNVKKNAGVSEVPPVKDPEIPPITKPPPIQTDTRYVIKQY